MIDKTSYLLGIFYLHCILLIIYLEMENMCTMYFQFIPGARGINRKSEKKNSASTGKFRSTGHISTTVLKLNPSPTSTLCSIKNHMSSPSSSVDHDALASPSTFACTTFLTLAGLPVALVLFTALCWVDSAGIMIPVVLVVWVEAVTCCMWDSASLRVRFLSHKSHTQLHNNQTRQSMLHGLLQQSRLPNRALCYGIFHHETRDKMKSWF